MGGLVLNGATSGSTTIQATDAVTATITLPSTSGTVVVNNGAQTIEFADGSASAPSITNSGDTNTGMFFPAADTIAFSEGGTESMRIDSGGSLLVGTTSKLNAGTLSVLSSSSTDYQISVNDTRAYSTQPSANIVFGGKYNAAGSYKIFGYVGGQKENTTDGNNAGFLAFGTASNGGSETERMRIDSSGNLGLGVTPSAWSGYKVLQAGIGSFIGGSSGAYILSDNAYTDNAGAGWKYINSSYAPAQYYAASGAHVWRTAPSGTAGNAITFTQAMTLDASGNLLVGTTSATSKVVIKCSTNNFNGGLQLHQSNFDTRWEYLVGSDGKLYLGYGVGATPSAVGNFASNGTYTATSDIRKKKDITYDFNATEIVMRLKPAMGRMIDDADESPLRPFYIAQDMKEVVPSLVSSLDPDQDAIDPIMGVDYASSAPLLAKMLQEQQAMIDELKAKVAALEAA